MSPSLSLTIIIPLHQEAEGVPALAERMQLFLEDETQGRTIDLVLVDDGSTDDTRSLLEDRFANLPHTLLHHDDNRGLTEALSTGLSVARGELVGWLDSDLTYDPLLLLRLADIVEEGADLALASCYHPQGALVGVPGWRSLISRIASRGYRLATGLPLHTYTSMVRVWRREALEACKPRRRGFAGVTESLLLALIQGRRVEEWPASMCRRRRGQSKMRVIRVGLEHLGLMVWATRVRRR